MRELSRGVMKRQRDPTRMQPRERTRMKGLRAIHQSVSPAAWHSGGRKAAEREKTGGGQGRGGGKCRMTPGEAREICEGGETVLHDTVTVVTWPSALVKTHGKYNTRANRSVNRGP